MECGDLSFDCLEKKNHFFYSITNKRRIISASIKHFKKRQRDHDLLDKLFHPQK